eukprot:5109525-Pleurochrysis_carterae.AAC.2
MESERGESSGSQARRAIGKAESPKPYFPRNRTKSAGTDPNKRMGHGRSRLQRLVEDGAALRLTKQESKRVCVAQSGGTIRTLPPAKKSNRSERHKTA